MFHFQELTPEGGGQGESLVPPYARGSVSPSLAFNTGFDNGTLQRLTR
jgi:hypothetical protein